MKKLLIAIAVLLIPITGVCGTLTWDHDGNGNPLGFTIYYEDIATMDQYNYTIADGTARSLPDFEQALELIPGHEYSIYITAYNTEAESVPSNSVSHQMAAYTPPADKKPVIITIQAPATLTITSP